MGRGTCKNAKGGIFYAGIQPNCKEAVGQIVADRTADRTHDLHRHRIPDQMPYTTAIFSEYVSMALNIIDKLNLKAGDHVAIMGASKLGYVLAQLVTYYQGIAIAIDENNEQFENLGKLIQDNEKAEESALNYVDSLDKAKKEKELGL